MYGPNGFTLGQPGQFRKTFDDGKFDLQGGVYNKFPCKLKPGFNVAADCQDGLFLSPDGAGNYESAPDAKRALYMIFTANQTVIIKQVTPADEFPGEDRTDTPTGFMGRVEAIWPDTAIFIGTRDAGTGAPTVVTLASYAVHTPLTIANGRLVPANVGGFANERVIGYVTVPTGTVGPNSVAVSVNF